MKKLIPLIALIVIVGCATQSRNIYNTLSSLHIATSGAYNAYLDLVVQGKIPTNSVPVVSRDYTEFQSAWNVAVNAAAAGVSAPPTQPVMDLAAQVTADINTAKGKK